MILTDLDGTLLRSDKSISERTLMAIDAAHDAGLLVLAATGRSLVDVGRVLPDVLKPRVICSNGATVYNALTDEILMNRPVSPEVVAAFVDEVIGVDPSARFALLTNGGRDFLAGPDYIPLMNPGDHGRPVSSIPTLSLDELVTHEATKIVVRSGSSTLAELVATCQKASHVGVIPTTSGVPFVEVSAAGVTKATTAALIATEHGISPQEVIAFGDSPNDLDMLTWAGRSVAMANAEPELLEAADVIARANDDEGWAIVVEELLGI